MVPIFQNTKLQEFFLQGLLNIFQGPFLCMSKKWFVDYKNKFRPEGMKNSNFWVFLAHFIKFQTMHISEIIIM